MSKHTSSSLLTWTLLTKFSNRMSHRASTQSPTLFHHITKLAVHVGCPFFPPLHATVIVGKLQQVINMEIHSALLFFLCCDHGILATVMPAILSAEDLLTHLVPNRAALLGWLALLYFCAASVHAWCHTYIWPLLLLPCSTELHNMGQFQRMKKRWLCLCYIYDAMGPGNRIKMC